MSGSRWQRIAAFFREELKPQPGRLKGTLVRVAGTLLSLWAGLALNLPQVGAILCLAFFASTKDRTLGKKVTMGVPPTVFVIFLLITLTLNVFGMDPLVRVVTFIVIIFGGLFLLGASELGPLFLLVAIFGKLFLEVWDTGYPSVYIQELQLWIIADLAVAAVCSAVVFSLFGDPEKDPVAEFRKELASRFDLLTRYLTDQAGSDDDKLREEAFGCRDRLLPLLEEAKGKDSEIKARHSSFAASIQLCELLLHQAVILGTYSKDARGKLSEALQWVGGRCSALAQAVRSADVTSLPREQAPSVDNSFASMMVSTADLAGNVLSGRVPPPENLEAAHKKGFFREDAFTNPRYVRNALRAGTAAFVCYFFIAASDWGDISTAVTTCLITALTTNLQSRQKQSLRFGGAAMGGLLGLFVMVYILPTGIGVAGLSVVTAVIALIGGWICEGGPRVSYAGVQLMYCYFLGAFGQNSTPTSLNTLRDRVVGIFIGITAMWIFYDRVQPLWTPDRSRKDFAEELAALGKLTNMRTRSLDGKAATLSLSSERKAFLEASSDLTALGDPRNFDFAFAGDVQREKASQVRRTESTLQRLFSFEFAAVETKLLRLPSIPTATGTKGLSDFLLSLSSRVRTARPIRVAGGQSDARDGSADEILVERVEREFASLFSSGKTLI